MPIHDCGINGYFGFGRGEAAGIFAAPWAMLIALGHAQIHAQRVYDRDCPGHCDDRKTGLVAYKLMELRLTQVPVSPPPGVRRRLGWRCSVKWRLWVSCMSDEVRRFDPSPYSLPWADLESLFRDHYHVSSPSDVDRRLTGIGVP